MEKETHNELREKNLMIEIGVEGICVEGTYVC